MLVSMTVKLFPLFSCLFLLTLSYLPAQAQTEAINKSELLNILEDDPRERELELITESHFATGLVLPDIFEAFNAILKNDNFRSDTEIRSKLLILSQRHPFTDVRAAATLLLSNFEGDRISPMFYFSRQQDGYNGPTPKQLNGHMEYCAPPRNAKRPDFEIRAEEEAKILKRGRPNYRFKVPTQYGAFSGGYYSIQGVGLSYQQNTAPYKKISLSGANNRYIMPTDSKNSFWLIDGPHHMIGGASISKLVETQDGVDRYLHRILPSSVSEILELPNGSIFITFVSLDPAKRGATWKEGVRIPSPLERYNPPIILNPNGTIKLACTEHATEF